MKLIIAVVQDEDSGKVVSTLMQNGFRVTKLATTGGFLKAGNTTLMIGVEDELLDKAVHTIESVCKSRKQLTSGANLSAGMGNTGFNTYPVEVTVGGATLFVLTVDQFLKV